LTSMLSPPSRAEGAWHMRRKRDIHVSFCQSEGFGKSRQGGKWAKWKVENEAQ
jgi:hypothetical protein